MKRNRTGDACRHGMQTTSPRHKRLKGWISYGSLISLSLIVGAESFARLNLGLGDPPLMMNDPEIEYISKPSSEYKRFGNRVTYNAYSMRSQDFPVTKSSLSELRILFIGDSVINGGAQTDQSELATEQIKYRLETQLNRPVVVGNVSCGGWGPVNQLAYVKRYGFFDADLVVIVTSSHDYADVPTFEPVVGVAPEFPDKSPVLAVQEAVGRYLPRYLHLRSNDKDVSAPTQQHIDQSIDALSQLIALAGQSGAQVMLAQHLEKSEAQTGRLEPGHDVIVRVASDAGIEPIQLGPAFADALAAGVNPYRDDIHPNAQGQFLMGQCLYQSIKSQVVRSVAMANWK